MLNESFSYEGDTPHHSWRNWSRKITGMRTAIEAVPMHVAFESRKQMCLRQVLLWLGSVVEILFEPPRLVREVGPNQRPLERHEFENPIWRSSREYGHSRF